MALRIESVEMPRHANVGAESESTMTLLAGESHSYRASSRSCPDSVATYGWTVETMRGIGFSGYEDRLNTSVPEASLSFPYPGAYDLWVDHLASDGAVIGEGEKEPPLHVRAYLFRNATVDGSSGPEGVPFSTFCCPYYTSLYVESSGSLASGWTIALKEASSGEVLWESPYGGAFGPEVYHEVLGKDFLADFVVEARPPARLPADLAGTATVRIVVGPGEPPE